MNGKISLGQKVFDIFNSSFMIFMMFLTLYPFLYVALCSISDPKEIIAHSGLLIKPLGFSLQAYELVFKNPMISQGFLNTILYVVLGTALNIIMTCMGAYVLSRKDFLIKKQMMMMIVFTMFFGGGLIPSFLLVKALGMYNSLLALIIPGAVGTYNLIILRTAFLSIPESLEESARLDGANDFTILFKIIIPLSLPTIAVMVLFYGVGHWNAWFNAMIYLRKRELYPIQLILREIIIASSTDTMTTGMGNDDKLALSESIKHATIMVATVPILLVYPFLQKYFMKGIMIGAVKG